MKRTILIQHYGHPFHSNENARLLFTGSMHHLILLLY